MNKKHLVLALLCCTSIWAMEKNDNEKATFSLRNWMTCGEEYKCKGRKGSSHVVSFSLPTQINAGYKGKLIVDDVAQGSYTVLSEFNSVTADGRPQTAYTIDFHPEERSHYTGILTQNKCNKKTTTYILPYIGHDNLRSNPMLKDFNPAFLKDHKCPEQKKSEDPLKNHTCPKPETHWLTQTKKGNAIIAFTSVAGLYGLYRILYDTRKHWQKLGRLMPAIGKKKISKKKK